MRTLLQIFQDTKEVLCRYDYYIHTQKRILHLTNSEIKIPHLMGMQYLGKPNQFTGDFGAYAIKKQRVTIESVEKLVRKYYKTKEKQRRILEMIHRKPHGQHLVDFKKKLISEIGTDRIQLVTISRPSAYGEYQPYQFIDTEKEFEQAVKKL